MEKDKDIIEIIVDEEADVTDILSVEAEDDITDEKETKKSLKEVISALLFALSDEFSSSFIKISCLVCIIIALLSLSVGILIPKSEQSIEERLLTMHEKNKLYISARDENTKLLQETDSLTKALEEKQTALDEAIAVQGSLEEIKQKNEELLQEEEKLKSSIESKKRALDTLTSPSTSKSKASFVDLSNGIYKVPDDIAPGTYNVTGIGSIVISNSNKNRVNETLSSEGKTYTLKDGDVISIQKGKARFIPE